MHIHTENKSIRFSHHRIRLTHGDYMFSDHSKRDMHPEYELLLSLDTGVFYAIEDKKFKLTPYSLLIVPANCYHYPYSEPPFTGYYDRFMLSFRKQMADSKLLQSVFRCPACYQLTPEHPISQSFLQLGEFAKSKTPEYTDLMLQTVCNKILLDIYLLQKTIPLETVTPATNYPVLAYIEEHLTDITSLEQIADHLYMSTSSLTHQFRSRMGISLMKYIRQKRLLLAHSLLEKGEKPLAVSAACGFREYTTFYKAYTSYFGFPPSKRT